MKRTTLSFLIAGAMLAHAATAAPLVYQGRLTDRGAPANGTYDIRVTAHADEALAAPLAAPLTFAGVAVIDGRFRLEGELAARLPDSSPAWIEVAVRDAGTGAPFETLGRREKIVLAPSVGACWSMTGDAATDATLNFLGTTDAQPLVLRVQNQRVSRFEPSTQLSGGAPVAVNVIEGVATNAVTAGVRGATVAGGGSLSAGADPSISGGGPNLVTDAYGTVGGGAGNRAGDGDGAVFNDFFATVAGGHENIAAAGFSAVGGGDGNVAMGQVAAIAGGRYNQAYAVGSAVGGGYGNFLLGNYSSVAGGLYNTTSGGGSAIVGGEYGCAGGDFSAAGGHRAKVRPNNVLADPCGGVPSAGDADGDEGTFVWADSQDADFVSSGPNQFLVRADGGVLFNTASAPYSTDDLVVAARAVAGDADSDLTWRTRSGRRARIYLSDGTGTLHVQAGDLTAGSNYVTFGNNAYLSNGGVFVNASSRAFKQAFAAVDPRVILDGVLALPIQTWAYRGSDEGRHIGPVAEDFQRAFGLAGDGAHIATIDADGVALAAIQGLNRKLEAENAELRRRIEALEAKAK